MLEVFVGICWVEFGFCEDLFDIELLEIIFVCNIWQFLLVYLPFVPSFFDYEISCNFTVSNLM